MPLSLNKLEKLLSSKGLIAKKFFTMHGMCVYIEVISIYTADIFMLYIPSKYEIYLDKGDNVYRTQYINITEDGNIPGDYAGEPDKFDLEKVYEEIDIDDNLEHDKKNNMTKHLEENYNHPVSLRDISKDDTLQLREVFRQLRRLKLCVQNIKYKLCITFQNYLCCIRRDDTFEGFIVQNLEKNNKLKLMVSLDLETLYSKIDSISIDIKTVKEGVYKVIDKNQHKHARNLQKMLEHKDNLTTLSELIIKKKTQYTDYLEKLEKLLATLHEAEKKNIEKLTEIDEYYNNGTASLKNLHTDIERTHQIAKYETELSRINVVKQELLKTILIIKEKHENIALRTDKIFFDNIIMTNAIVKNMAMIGTLC